MKSRLLVFSSSWLEALPVGFQSPSVFRVLTEAPSEAFSGQPEARLEAKRLKRSANGRRTGPLKKRKPCGNSLSYVKKFLLSLCN